MTKDARRALLVGAAPVAVAYAFGLVMTDPDEGANIGAGILVLISFPVGLLLGLLYFVTARRRRRR